MHATREKITNINNRLMATSNRIMEHQTNDEIAMVKIRVVGKVLVEVVSK